MTQAYPFQSRRGQPFPPYELLDERPPAELDERVRKAEDKTRKLTRLYHQTQAHAWNPNEVLDGLVARHGGIRVPEDKKEPLGRLFAVLLWGELAAWNVAADLARWLPDIDARMAATGQVFDEARHFTVLRDYLRRGGVPMAPLNPFGRRLLNRILDTPSLLAKLYGMQMLVETLALGIFKGLKESNVEPVLTDLLEYVERDEARHVGLGVLYVPKLFGRASTAERARTWAMQTEFFLLTVAGGQRLDPDLCALGIDHRGLAQSLYRINEHIAKQMRDDHDPSDHRRTMPGLTGRQHLALIDFLHPEHGKSLTSRHRLGLGAIGAAVDIAERILA
jgi:hypothetical protein